jgi:signal transduction histidine kinase
VTSLRTPPANIRGQLDELEAKTAALEQQLIQSQRLATLGTLSMSVAHEFNNLLMTIINQADLALAADKPEMYRRALEKTLGCGETASTLIRNMLGFARASGGERVRLRATQIMNDAVALLGRDPAKDGITVDRDFDESLEVEGSRVELTQVLLNLMINARQAMTDGGGGTLTLKVCRQKQRVVLSVGDTGCGIQPEHMKQLFDPFFTTKKVGLDGYDGDAGTGLGLWLAQQVVVAHGGDIRIVSQPGEGATFTIYLPEAK